MKAFDYVERYTAFALLGLMSVMVAAATLEVAYSIVTNVFVAPGFFIGVDDLLEVFGLFLMVLIGLELMASVRSYLKDQKIHAELMLLVAITAVTRKLVIIDAKAIDPMVMFAIGFVIITLTVGYWLVRRTRAELRGEDDI